MSEKSEQVLRDAIEKHVGALLHAELQRDELHVYLSWDKASGKVTVNCFSTLALNLLDRSHKTTVGGLDELIDSVLEGCDRKQAKVCLDQIQASLDKARAGWQKVCAEWDREHRPANRR